MSKIPVLLLKIITYEYFPYESLIFSLTAITDFLAPCPYLIESLATQRAFVRSFARVREDVVLEIAFLVEGFITVRTLMPFHQVVSSLVGVERGIAIESGTADGALERLVCRMNRLLEVKAMRENDVFRMATYSDRKERLHNKKGLILVIE